MKEKLEKEAYKLRFEYFNLYENKETKWHEKYRNHDLYNIIVKSLDYRFHEIGNVMPKLLEELKNS
ncbi:hypothetical protein [Halarcobacter sp.]|uniref:hypothetical protein n=1 Tax=Halarcobacter sp. TaxID=2321133 RepID=UPI003B007ED8